MKLLRLSLLASLFAVYSGSLIDPPTITLPGGKLEGKLSESAVARRKFAAFYSIPYAKAPIEQLRFKEPVPSEPWKGTLLATELAPVCPQVDLLNPVPLKIVGSEDCLYLNVFTPQLPETNSKQLDVVFVIHGGAFAFSSGNDIDTGKLMDRDVVVVTMNYRLGALGFLSTEDFASPGNNGLKDQNLALKWTKENIAYFGGDSNKITISGCSAGGASVHYHLLSETSKGLFQKAISESGSALSPWAIKEDPKKDAIKLSSALGCPTKCTEGMVECLRERPASHIILKQSFNIYEMAPIVEFVPTVEPPNPTAFLDKHPRQVMANGDASDVPILSSFSKDEGLLFVRKSISGPKELKELEDNWVDKIVPLVSNEEQSKDQREVIAHALKQRYFGSKPVIENKVGLVKMMSDWGFFVGIEESSKMMAKANKSPLYAYQFAYPGKFNFTKMALPEGIYKGVNHCEQSLYVTPFVGCKTAEGEPMSERMFNLAMNFIKGKPLAKNWRPVNDGLPKYSLFKISSSEWDDNELELFYDFSNGELWRSLKSKSVDSHYEL